MKKLLFIYNPCSGKGKISKNVDKIKDIFTSNSYDTSLYPTKAPLDGKNYVKDHGNEYDLIVCAGGDGTVNEIASGLYESHIDKPLACIPSGSTNDFGKSIGLNKNMIRSAQIAVTGKEELIDIGTFNDKPFVYVSAFGAFTELTYKTPQEFKKKWGHLAYLIEGIKSIPKIRPFKIRASWNENNVEHTMEDDFIVGIISSSKSIGGFKFITGNEADLTDGLFEVTFVRKIKNISDLFHLILFLLMEDHKTKLITSFQTDKIKIGSDENIPWTLDGEDGGIHNSADIKNIHRSLNIISNK